jgi:glucose/arabinose dehydrogenase
VKLTQVVDGLESPVALFTRPGDKESLFVVEQGGKIIRFNAKDGSDRETVLDLSESSEVGGEQGLLGAAFNASGDELYVSFSAKQSGATVLSALAYPPTDLKDPGTTFLTLDQPFGNHNGGTLVRGPDDRLWFGFGDGGGAGDPEKNGQNPKTLLGTIIRIEPLPLAKMGDAPADRRYTIPADNPFAAPDASEPSTSEAAAGAPEVWLWGVRNPWKFSFDSKTGDLWVADVGQGDWEEIDLLPAANGTGKGANLGWNLLEGTHRYPPDQSGTVEDVKTVPPVLEYSHSDGGCSVTGGEVYRGKAVPGLVGFYVFGDFCKTQLMAVSAKAATDAAASQKTVEPVVLKGDIAQFSGAGTGPDGELYLASYAGSVSRIEAD